MSDVFNLLTSVGPKPFLNINCNSVNCTTLTATNIINANSNLSVFNATNSGSVIVAQSATNSALCIGSLITCPNYNPVSNIFTAPVPGYYQFYFNCSVQNGGIANVGCRATFVQNSALSLVQCLLTVVAPTPAFNSDMSLNYVAFMNVGDTMGYNFINTNASANTVLVFQPQFNGFLISQL